MVEAAATLQGELIAGQAQLSGLRANLRDSNVRVRAAEARVNELKKKLNEIGGIGTQSELNSDNSLYPSIRKLPLLGVTYADLYRQTKIQETVYELLTQQYELAKVQEAKEIPTVKVLDEALCRRKSRFLRARGSCWWEPLWESRSRWRGWSGKHTGIQLTQATHGRSLPPRCLSP